MNSETTNKLIHTWMGRCWHEIDVPDYGDGANCKKCNKFVHFEIPLDDIFIEQNPRYDSEDSPRSLLAEVERKVIEEVGIGMYCEQLVQSAYKSTFNPSWLCLAMATAAQRCAAIVAALGLEEQDEN